MMHHTPRPRRAHAITAAVLVCFATLTLAGCQTTVALEPAADAANAQCAEVVVRLPDDVSTEYLLRTTSAQGTGAWGTPTAIILRCGVPVPDPTSTLPCVSVSGIDWLRDDADDPTIIMTTYGRTPAIEVIIDRDKASPGIVLVDLASAVSYTTKTGECTVIEDSL